MNNNITNCINKVIEYIKQYPDKYNKLVVYGECLDKKVENPEELNLAIGLVDNNDVYNFNLLGELLIYANDHIEDMICTVLPISDKVVSNIEMNLILKGEIVYELKSS